MVQHEKYMQRCLELAALGMGAVSPNPMVGAVVVLNDKIIGEGYHQKYGEAHAEVNAINQVVGKFEDSAELLKQATIYVSLEPCAHYGKTPPCADLIIKHQIPNVVVGCRDPFAQVDGKGIEKLQAAGIAITVGVLQAECQWLNRRFFTHVQKHRPYIILKWAQTANGFFAPEDNRQYWITGPEARKLVHEGLDWSVGLGFISAAVFGFLAIAVLIRYVRTRDYVIFAVYRLVVAAIVIGVFLARA